jgi:hypothetical protein
VKGDYKKTAARFIFHLELATVASVVFMAALTAVLLAPLLKWEGAQSLAGMVFSGLYSPQIWAPGLVLGFLVNREMRNRAACRVWFAPVVWLACGIWDECRIYRFPPLYPPKGDFLQRAWHMFFTSNNTKAWGDTGLLPFLFTMPALSSIAYSVGAWLALQSKRKDRKRGNPRAESSPDRVSR